MQYSPKLKKAMEEIKAIVAKYDIAGIICLHTPGFQEYANVLNPSYSALSLKKNESGFEIKGHRKHYFNNAEMRDQKLADTKNMVDHFVSFTGKEFMVFHEISKKMEATWGKWDSAEGDETTHEQQNN